MPLRYINLINTPPGGFKYHVDESNRDFTEHSYRDLVRKVIAHLKANNYPVPSNIEERLHEYGCNQSPPGWCEHNLKPGEIVALVGFGEALEFTRTIGQWLARGEMVPVEESDRRAKICGDCPFNQGAGCPTCVMDRMRDAINSFSGWRKTKHDSALNICQICGCSLKLKVLVPLDILHKNMPQEKLDRLPDWCWLKPHAD